MGKSVTGGEERDWWVEVWLVRRSVAGGEERGW